jgi:cysteine synthase
VSRPLHWGDLLRGPCVGDGPRKEEGIFAGQGTESVYDLRTSSGLNITAALQLAQQLGRGSTVATVVDTGFKYLAGDLYRE